MAPEGVRLGIGYGIARLGIFGVMILGCMVNSWLY